MEIIKQKHEVEIYGCLRVFISSAHSNWFSKKKFTLKSYSFLKKEYIVVESTIISE